MPVIKTVCVAELILSRMPGNASNVGGVFVMTGVVVTEDVFVVVGVVLVTTGVVFVTVIVGIVLVTVEVVLVEPETLLEANGI